MGFTDVFFNVGNRKILQNKMAICGKMSDTYAQSEKEEMEVDRRTLLGLIIPALLFFVASIYVYSLNESSNLIFLMPTLPMFLIIVYAIQLWRKASTKPTNDKK